eukprot:8909552-Prorocentrum_lima.AAC.1
MTLLLLFSEPSAGKRIFIASGEKSVPFRVCFWSRTSVSSSKVSTGCSLDESGAGPFFFAALVRFAAGRALRARAFALLSELRILAT